MDHVLEQVEVVSADIGDVVVEAGKASEFLKEFIRIASEDKLFEVTKGNCYGTVSVFLSYLRWSLDLARASTYLTQIKGRGGRRRKEKKKEDLGVRGSRLRKGDGMSRRHQTSPNRIVFGFW